MRGFDVVEPGVFRDPRSGKIYTSVSYRTRQFREKYPLWGVDFKEMPYEGGNGITADDTRGRFIKMRCEIRDENDRLIAVGHAEEDRKFGPVNRTSAIENAETSALGRALANLGFLSDQYASAEEVEQAQARERAMDRYDRGDHPANVTDRQEGEVKVKPRPKPQKREDDDDPYSDLFKALLVEIGTATTPAEMKDLQRRVKENQEDLSETETNELRTQFLARRASLKGGK